MKSLVAISIGFALWITALPAPVSAADPSVGQQDYETRCVMCHGRSGNGDSWLAEHLIKSVPPLTQLQKSNGNVFPFERTYQVLDGRNEVGIHGPRTMPVWGEVDRAQSDLAYASNPWRLHLGEAFVRYRILALIEYISQLQE